MQHGQVGVEDLVGAPGAQTPLGRRCPTCWRRLGAPGRRCGSLWR